MSAAYDKEQTDLKAQNETLRDELAAFEQDNLKADNFLALVRRYTEFDELTTEMLNNFVDKIYVHEADKSSGERRQEVEVHLNYIGKFTIPGDEPKPLTPEEIAAAELAKQVKQAEWQVERREYQRNRVRQDRASKATVQAAQII
jgi:hypothetical protein